MTRIEDLCHAQVSHKWLYLDACAGSVLSPHDCITNVQKRLGNRVWAVVSVDAAVPSWAHSFSTRRNLQHCRSQAGCTSRVFTPWFAARNLRILALPRNPKGSLLRNPGRLIFFTAAVPGRSAALDVCVASSIAAAARGDAAKAAFDRKLSHYRNATGELRRQGIYCSPLVWTADGRPHPAVTATLQYAADIASSRNGQHLSAK